MIPFDISICWIEDFFQEIPDLPKPFEKDQARWDEKEAQSPLHVFGSPCSVCLLPVAKNEENQHEICGLFVDHLDREL